MASIDNIGLTLKTARESFNKSLFDLSKLTNLSVKQLSLLEENKFDEIGEGVFIIGFLRIYAKVLHINANLIIEAYKKNHENATPLQPSVNFDNSATSEIKDVTFIKKIVITFFVGITAFLLIFIIEKNKKESVNVSSINKFEQIDDTINNSINSNEQIDLYQTTNNSASYESKNNDLPSISLRLVFSQECWIEIRDVEGNIVNSSVNPANSELSFDSNLPLSFIFGNAEGVDLYISGSIFDHKPFTKISVARFTIPNDE